MSNTPEETKRDEHKRRRSASRKRRIIRTIKKFAINGTILLVAAAIIFALDYYVVSKEEDEFVDEPLKKPVQSTQVEEEEKISPVALPEKSYAFVGKPITLYFMDVIGYNSLEELQVQVDTGNKGTVYDDRWEYTPTQVETVELSFTVTNNNDKVINKSTHTIEVKDKTEKEALSVLVIGDSTIEAGYETKQLLELAKEDNYNLKLLGTQTTPHLMDNNNRFEGRGGWRAEHYVSEKMMGDSLNPFYNPTAKAFDFTYYMESQRYTGYTEVDCVVLQLGINDVFGAVNDSELSNSYIPRYFKWMDHIIGSIHEYDPTIKIVWNLILPGSVDQKKFENAYDGKRDADRYKWNTYLTNLEIVKHAAGMENVYVAPTNITLDTHVDMAGSSHGAVNPGTDGYNKIGNLLYSFLRAIN